MTDTSGFSDYIAPQGPGQERILMTPNQIATKRKIGVPTGTTYVRPDADPGSTKAFAPDLVTVDTTGTLRTGPYEDPGLESAYRERLTKQDDAALEKQAQEVLDAAGEEEAAEVAAKADPNATPEWKSLPERMTGLDGLGAVGSDMLRSVPEILPALAVAGKKAVNEFIDFADSLADALPFSPAGIAKNVLRDQGFTNDQLAPPQFDTAQSEAKIKTVTGNFTKVSGQFAAGFAGAGKFLKGWKAAGTTARIMKGMAQGAIADFTVFDGQEKRLSNMLNEMAPELRNPITEFLAADEDDPELLGRAKNALEGAGLGAGVEGVMTGIRVLKQVRKVKEAVRTEAAAMGHTIDPTIAPEAAEAASKKLEAEVEKALKPAPKPSMAKKAKAQAGVVPQDAKALAADLTTPGQDEVVALQNALEAIKKERVKAEKAAKATSAPAEATTFTTAKGSTYRVEPNGTTTRDKAARPEHPGEQGIQPTSEDTFYLPLGVVQDKLAIMQAKGGNSTHKVVRDGDHYAVKIVGGPDDGKLVKDSVFKPEREPATGLIPVEIWKDGTRIHFGNEIVSVSKSGQARVPDPALAKQIEDLTAAEAKAAADLKAAEDRSGQVPNTFDLPMHRMNTIEDVQAVILKMTNANAKNIDNARRGIQTWADTTKKAEAIDALESMAVRRRGDALNAETILAYKQAMIAANEKLLSLAQDVLAEPGNVAKQIALRRATAVTHAINMEFMGARAEAGRALQALKIAPESNAYRGLDLEAMLRETGGAEGAAELADKILRTAANKGAAFDMTSGWEHFGAALKMVYTNGLLAGPATSMVNVLGNSIALMQDLAVRMAARTEAGVTEHEAGEAFAVMSGYMGAMRDVFRLNPKQAFGEMSWGKFKDQGAFRGMAPGLDDAMPTGVARGGREDAGRAGSVVVPADPKLSRPLSAAAFNVDEASGLGRFLDAVQMTIEVPGNVNALGDDFFATLAARGELRAQAFRKAMKEGRAQGWDKDQIWVRQAELLAAPTRDMLDAAETQMKELTFTRSDGQFEQSIQKIRRQMDTIPGLPLGTAFMPFIRTPANLMSYAIRNSPMAPASARWRNAMAAGGAEREVALTQFALGTAAYAVFMEATMNGDMTGGGPKNKAQRDAMMRADAEGNTIWQPYSVRVGGRWYAYDRAEPVGQNMSLAADLSELIANSDWDESQQENLSEASAHVMGAIGAALFDKTILQGTFDTIAAVTGDNTTTIEREAGNRLTGLVPFSGLARTVRRGQDPYMREVSGMLDSLKNSMPGLSDDLPESRDLWGRPRTYQTGIGVVYDAIQPIKTKAAGGSAIDYEILDNGVSVQMPQRSFTIDGVNVSLKNHPEIYSEYVRQAGEPAFEQLEAVVTGDHPDSAYYFSLSDGPTGGKATYIKSVIEDYRKVAKEMILEQYGDQLNKLAADKLKRVEDARTGTTPVR